MAEIVVVHGYAGSGKSTQCERLTKEGFEGAPVQHISAGNRLREIRTMKAGSSYADIINGKDAPSPLPDEIVSGAIFEAIQPLASKSFVLIDGYPRHPEAVEAFYETLQAQSHTLLGTIALWVSREVSVGRILSRGERSGEKIHGDTLEDFAIRRYDLDSRTTNVAVDALAEIAPVERIDASDGIDIVHARFRQSLGRLALLNPDTSR